MPTQRVTVQQAATNALRKFFESQAELSGVLCDDRWPEPDTELPDRMITILHAGERQDERIPEELVRVDDLTGVQARCYWRVKACRQPLQLDVWARYSTHRDDILANLDDVLHKGTLITLGSGDPVRDGPLLQLDEANDGHFGYADFTFDGFRMLDGADQHRQNEYRATCNGHVDVELVVSAETAKIARILLEMSLGTYTFEPQDGEFQITSGPS